MRRRLLQLARIIAPDWNRRSIALHALAMLACWLPYAIAFAPGTMGFDTFYQIYQFYPDHDPILLIPWESTGSWLQSRFCDHHPIFDTLLFGSFAYTSDMLTGSWNAGLAVYMALQMCAMALSFSTACGYLARLDAPHWIRVPAYAFYCLCPVVAVYSVSILKDTLFSWIFVLYFLLTCEIALTHGELLENVKWTAALIVLSALLCLTKKTGVYVVLLESACLLVLYRRQWARIGLAAGVSAALMLVVLPLAVFPALDVAPGGRQEALGVTFQQTARYVRDFGGDVTDEERAAIDRVLPYEQLDSLYDPAYADTVKYAYRWDTATGNDIAIYLGAWLAEGLRHPDAYAAAIADVVAPFFDPTATMALYIEQGTAIDERVNASFPEATEGMRTFICESYEALGNLPALGTLFSACLYCFWVPPVCFIVACAGPRRRAVLPAFFLVALMIGSYLISPMALSRYVLPLVYIAPVLAGLAGYSRSFTRGVVP